MTKFIKLPIKCLEDGCIDNITITSKEIPDYYVIGYYKDTSVFSLLKKSTDKKLFVVEEMPKGKFYHDYLVKKYGNYSHHGKFEQENWAVQKAMELEAKEAER